MHGQSVSRLRTPSNDGDRQPRSTEVNEAQRDIGGVAATREPVLVDWRLVRMCTDELQAVNLCIDLSQQKDEVIARRLGIDKGHFSRIRKGMAHFPTAKRLALMRFCENWVPVQFELEHSRVLPRLLAEMQAMRDLRHPAASAGYALELRA